MTKLKKRVGIDARLWSESGVGRYIRNLITKLSKLDHNNQYFIFLQKQNLEIKLPKNFTKVEVNIPWYSLSEQINLPGVLNKLNLDLVHFPHFNVPIFYRGKFVVTIHDLIHQHFKMQRASTLNPLIYHFKHLAYKRVFSSALKRSEQIITVSEFVKGQLRKECNVPGRKITVALEGVEENILDLSERITQKDMKNVLLKFKISPPFLFYVGNAHPHKNVEGLIEAFLTLRRNYQYLKLVLSGSDHYFWQEIREKYDHRDIIYTGFINDPELVALYKSAQCFVMPSFEEGFGIPLLEAMASNCPVVSSVAGSLPEVGGNAALYFDPKRIDDITEKIMFVLNNLNIRKELIGRGQKRFKQFSWDKLAIETLKIYNQTI